MKNILMALGCLLFILSACGKNEEKAEEQIIVQKEEQPILKTVKVKKLPKSKSAFINSLEGKTSNFLREFYKLDDAHQYYFCAAFAMGAMSASKPITASAMVNYFMGLGVAKYRVGIDDSTYESFNAGKNVFLYEELVNTILEKKICEEIINDAIEYARDNKFDAADLDKRGKIEVEKVVEYIKKEK